MKFKLKLLALLFIPVSLAAQTQNDAGFDMIPKACDGKVFTKTAIKPTLKISAEAYGDSLMAYLASKDINIENSAFPCRFILTADSQVLNVKVGNKPSPNGLALAEAIVRYKDLLKPAVQNSYLVCSYITFMVVFENDRINVAILQGF